MTDKKIVTVDPEHDPFFVATWPDSKAALRVTLSFEGDFLPMFPLPADIAEKIDEETARNQFSRNLFAYISVALQGGEDKTPVEEIDE